MTAKRVHLVDGTFELYRAHFSKRPDIVDKDGRDVKATLGLVRSMIALVREAEEEVTHLAIAFDNPIVCFRNDLFDGYKTDEGVPQVLRDQFDLVEEACSALGLRVWSMREFEADDALAAGAHSYASATTQVRLLSPDKDIGQCLLGESVVQIDRIRKKLMTEASMRAQRGFPVRSIPDWLGLVGDTADGIPGLKGFGDRTAAALLDTFESIENIPDDASTWPAAIRGKDRLAATLSENREVALLYKKLATLRKDAPISKLDELVVKFDERAWSTFVSKLGHPDYASWLHAMA